MLSIRAGYFHVECPDLENGIEQTCQVFCQPPINELDVAINGQHFRLTDAQWDDHSHILTGTMWKVRTNNLPFAYQDGTTTPIHTDLAEPASFAYMPSRSEALVQYSHSGPRHQLLSSFFQEIGLREPVSLSPVIDQKTLERMEKAKVVRRLEYTLSGEMNIPALRDAGVGKALESMKEVEGAFIHVEISLGRTGGSLSGMTKAIAKKLKEVSTGVKSVRMGVKESEESSMEMLDLLGGRLLIDMNIEESGRQLDHRQCRERLRMALKERRTTSDEVEDDDNDESGEADSATSDQP